MDEAEGLGMKCLTWKELEAVFYELSVFCIDGSFADLGTVVTFVIEERVTDPVEMNTDLMGTACLKAALDYGHISEALQHSVVSHCMLSMVAFRENLETHPVIRITAYVSCDGAFIFLEITPHDGYITAFYRMYKELLCQIELSLVILGYDKKSGSVLVDPMHKHTHPFILCISIL